MVHNKAFPHPSLAAYIRCFEERSLSLCDAATTLRPPARIDQFIEFYLAAPYEVSKDDGASFQASPEIVLVGPQSHASTILRFAGEIRTFSIGFKPSAFHRLTGLDMKTLTDQGIPVGDVLGWRYKSLRAAVLAAPDFAARVQAAQTWLSALVATAAPGQSVDWAASLLVRSRGQLPLGHLIEKSGLGDRHFRRRFAERTGLSPKLFARTVRLNAVFDRRAARPDMSWTDLAHAAGYNDQSHFIRDCRDLGGSLPEGLMQNYSA